MKIVKAALVLAALAMTMTPTISTAYDEEFRNMDPKVFEKAMRGAGWTRTTDPKTLERKAFEARLKKATAEHKRNFDEMMKEPWFAESIAKQRENSQVYQDLQRLKKRETAPVGTL